LAQKTGELLRHRLGGRKAQALLALGAVAVGLAFNWSWLVAAGIAPILIAFAPCAAMCALGLCMNKMGEKSCSGTKDDASTRAQGDVKAQKGIQ
jgi:hypothetical protein